MAETATKPLPPRAAAKDGATIITSPPSADQALEELGRRSVNALLEFFDSGDADPSAIARARIAASALSSVTRAKQVQGAREATIFMMAREIATDKAQLERYIRLTMPQSPLAKALPPAAES